MTRDGTRVDSESRKSSGRAIRVDRIATAGLEVVRPQPVAIQALEAQSPAERDLFIALPLRS